LNFSDSVKLMGAWNRFRGNHPKFPAFLNAVKQEGLREGSVIEISVTTPEGRNMVSNLKITESDLELLASLRDMAKER